jgi:predicted transglutaminase-like cysteine proteinase
MGMTPKQAVNLVNAYWEYEPDGKVDRWEFKSPGDCENYALLVLKNLAGGQREAVRWLLSGRAHIWYVKTLAGRGHAVLEYRGRFVDNRVKEWRDSLDEMRLQDTPRRRYNKLQLVAKLGLRSLLW